VPNNRTILLVVNPIAGRKRRAHDINKAVALFENENSISLEKIYWKKPSQKKEIQSYIKEKAFDTVVGFGGDGTAQMIAQALLGKPTKLGIVPTGSGNGSSVAYQFSLSNQRGFFSYILNSAKSIFTYKSKTYNIQTEHGSFQTKALLINCANINQYGNNAYIAPNAKVDDNQLELTIIKPFPFWAIPGLIKKLFSKNIYTSNYVQHLQAKDIKIECEQEEYIHIDGEVQGLAKSVSIQLSSKSLRVLVP